MKTHVLTGSKQEIAESLARIGGEVREAIVFVEEPAPGGARGRDARRQGYLCRDASVHGG